MANNPTTVTEINFAELLSFNQDALASYAKSAMTRFIEEHYSSLAFNAEKAEDYGIKITIEYLGGTLEETETEEKPVATRGGRPKAVATEE